MYILGDFNICFKEKKSVLYRKYVQILRLFNLKQIIEEPTRVTINTSSLLDHILSSHKNKIAQSGTIPIGISDHFLTFCTRKVVKAQFHRHNNVTIRSLKNYSAELFLYKLANADWSSVFITNSVDTAWKSFKKVFISVLDSVAPVKEIRLKQRSEPWLTTEIIELIKERDNLLQMFRNQNKS